MMNKMKFKMRLMYVISSLLLVTSASFAQNGGSVVKWKRIVGVTTAIDTNAQQSNTAINNPVGNVKSATFAWEARSGSAKVNLATGATSFDVEGLVINGTIFSGTPGPITAVTGCVVCNAGTNQEGAFDTEQVPLDSQGDASFSGQIQGIPATCNNPIFLIRIAQPQGAAGFWLATGVDRTLNNRAAQ